MKKTALGIRVIIIFVIVVVSTIVLTLHLFNAAPEIIHILADGSVEPTTAPVQRNGDTYTLTANISSDACGIVVERDNVTLDGAGYTLQGSGNGTGVVLSCRSNIRIENMKIDKFHVGILLNYSNINNVSGNDITTSDYGICLWSSSNCNNISGNSITSSQLFAGGQGISLNSSDNNSIFGNGITAWSPGYGVALDSSSNNSFTENSVTFNGCGILLQSSSSSNSISGNSITNNDIGVSLET